MAICLAKQLAVPIIATLTHDSGRRFGLLVSNIVFVIGCLVSLLVHSGPGMIAGRVVSGLGGGPMLLLPIVVLDDQFSVLLEDDKGHEFLHFSRLSRERQEEAERSLRHTAAKTKRYYQAIQLFTFALGSATGAPAGGFMASKWGWKSVFYLSVVLGVLSIFHLYVEFGETKVLTLSEKDEERLLLMKTELNSLLCTFRIRLGKSIRHVDWPGVFFIFASLALILVGITLPGNVSTWPYWDTRWLVASVGFGVLLVFTCWQIRLHNNKPKREEKAKFKAQVATNARRRRLARERGKQLLEVPSEEARVQPDPITEPVFPVILYKEHPIFIIAAIWAFSYQVSYIISTYYVPIFFPRYDGLYGRGRRLSSFSRCSYVVFRSIRLPSYYLQRLGKVSYHVRRLRSYITNLVLRWSPRIYQVWIITNSCSWHALRTSGW